MKRLIARARRWPLFLMSAAAGPGPGASGAVPPIAYQSRTLANGLRVYAIRDTEQLQRLGPGLVRRRLEGRSARPLGLRAPVRAYDVQVDPQHGARAVRPADRGCRRLQQRLDQRRLHQLLRGRPGQPPAAPALGRGRADGLAGRRAGLLRLRARRGEGGVAQPRPRRALRAAVLPLSTRRSPTTCIPMRRPGIGSIEDLDAATIDDVRAFHATYYRPDNAVLVVAGNFDPGAARPLGRPVFRRRSRGPPAPIPRVTAVEPERTAGAALHRLRAEHAAAGGADLLSGAAGERRATRRRWRCSTASSRPARARGSTRASSIATGSPRQASSFVDIKQGRGTLAVYAILAERPERRGRRGGAARARSPASATRR